MEDTKNKVLEINRIKYKIYMKQKQNFEHVLTCIMVDYSLQSLKNCVITFLRAGSYIWSILRFLHFFGKFTIYFEIRLFNVFV